MSRTRPAMQEKKILYASKLYASVLYVASLYVYILYASILYASILYADKEGQSVYGPSLAPLEETVDVPGPFGGTETLQVTALGRSKAAHEFLVLHYFGLDSAMHWDVLMSEVLPAVQLPGASARRATALEIFWGYAHSTVASQNASCLVDRLNDFDLEPVDGG